MNTPEAIQTAAPESRSSLVDSEYSGTELEALSAAVNYRHWILEKFTGYFGDSVAEVGAGIGSFSKLLLHDSAKELFAFEPSNNMFPLLAQALSDEPRAHAINDFFDPSHVPGGVDSVVYINVLEHIDDHRAELEKAYQALRPKGHLLVFVPALWWLYGEFDRHVGHFRRYSKRSLVGLAEGVGFKICDARYFDVAGIIPWYVSFVLMKKCPRASSVVLYDKLVVPPMRRLEGLIAPPIGKNVLIIAQKV